MKKVSLTSFVDFVQLAGKKKRSKHLKSLIRKSISEYSKSEDYYRILKGRVIGYVKGTRSFGELLESVDLVTQGHQKKNFHECIAALAAVINENSVKWICPIKGEWASGDLTVNVTPEFIIKFNGNDYATRLYFRIPELNDSGKGCLLYLINSVVNNSGLCCAPAIWDVRRKSMITNTSVQMLSEKAMEDEARQFMALWSELAA